MPLGNPENWDSILRDNLGNTESFIKMTRVKTQGRVGREEELLRGGCGKDGVFKKCILREDGWGE